MSVKKQKKQQKEKMRTVKKKKAQLNRREAMRAETSGNDDGRASNHADFKSVRPTGPQGKQSTQAMHRPQGG